jgi:hypothetical protein
MLKVPAIPMIRILSQFARSKEIPFRITNWENIYRTYLAYVNNSKPLN